MREAARDARASVNNLYRVSYGFVERHARERPYVVLGTAAGIGFVLGGGLASRFTAVLAATGARVLAAELLESSLNERAQDITHA
jgi:hypothetical protein